MNAHYKSNVVKMLDVKITESKERRKIEWVSQLKMHGMHMRALAKFTPRGVC
jgi:hypothetical protein